VNITAKLQWHPHTSDVMIEEVFTFTTVIVYKCHLSEKVGAVCVQTLQVQLHTAAPAALTLPTHPLDAARSILSSLDHFYPWSPMAAVQSTRPN
jgi:hypothetical protein